MSSSRSPGRNGETSDSFPHSGGFAAEIAKARSKDRFVGDVGLAVAIGLLGESDVATGEVFPLRAKLPAFFLLSACSELRGECPILLCWGHWRLLLQVCIFTQAERDNGPSVPGSRA